MDLLKKLHINTAEPLALVNAPEECLYLFEGADAKAYTFRKPTLQLILFTVNSTELFHFMHKLEGCILPETVFWIFRPKKSGSIASDLFLMKPWEEVMKLGYRGSSSAEVNDDWTAFRMTNAPRKKNAIGDIPQDQRKTEGIDYINRTAALPADALEAVNQYPGMAAFFNNLAFTHKKEHVMAIVEAKKPETRQRRIAKMIELLQQQMMAKGR